MKFLSQMAFGSDWGCFLYFSENTGDHFDWHGEVGDTSVGKQVERDAFYAKLGQEKQELRVSVGHTFTTDKVLSIQLAKFFDESIDEWSVKNHKKTFDALNRLTKLGYNVDRPSDLAGKKMTFSSEGELLVDGKGAKIEKTDIVKQNEVTDKNKKKDEKKVIKIDEMETVINKNEKKIIAEQKLEKLTTTVISQDFLTENISAENEKKKIEPEMKKIKKTPEQAKELQDNLDKVNQDFANVKAQIQKALESQFDKGKLEGMTPAQMESELQGNDKYTKLYEGLKPLFQSCRTLEEQKKYLSAVVAVDALYDVDAGYKSRYDVKEEDVFDVEEDEKTDFAKKYETAEGALQELGDKKVENMDLFTEMQEGYERARLVVHAKKGMNDLAELGEPVSTDFPKIQKIKAQIIEARTHGAINEMFTEDELTTLLQKERRSSHMQAKENAEKAYGEVPEEYKEDLASLTEKALAKGDIYGLISILATAMTNPLNKEKDPEIDKEDGETWETKHLDQGTANGIESLILRRNQLEKSLSYSNEFENLFPSDHIIFSKERRQGQDKTWLKEEDITKFQILEKKLNVVYSLYEKGEPTLLQNDLERQYGGKFAKRLETARANIAFRLDQPDMAAHEKVKSKVDVTEGILSFEKVETSKE